MCLSFPFKFNHQGRRPGFIFFFFSPEQGYVQDLNPESIAQTRFIFFSFPSTVIAHDPSKRSQGQLNFHISPLLFFSSSLPCQWFGSHPRFLFWAGRVHRVIPSSIWMNPLNDLAQSHFGGSAHLFLWRTQLVCLQVLLSRGQSWLELQSKSLAGVLGSDCLLAIY